MKREFISEKDFSKKMVEVDDVKYNILKEISKLHPQSYTDVVVIDENGEPSILIERGETHEEKEIGGKRYRIKIEKLIK